MQSLPQDFSDAIAETHCICGCVTEGGSLSICLVQRQLKLAQHFSDSRWEMETDFSWDSKHCELLTGNDTQRQNTHPAVISADTPGCKALRINYITRAHIHTCPHADIHNSVHTHTYTQCMQASNKSKQTKICKYRFTYIHYTQNRWTVTILHPCTCTNTNTETHMHICTNTDDTHTHTQSTADSQLMKTSLVCQSSFPRSQLDLDWQTHTPTHTHTPHHRHVYFCFGDIT